MNDKIGRFGILTCNLTDPLSMLINKITISYDNKYNSIGFYYINDDGDYNIILFDLYDSYHIKWTISHCILSYFITSLYVIKIDFYSFDEEKYEFPSIYNTNVLKYNKNNVRNKLEEKFINIISGLLISYNYERNYNSYLINIANNKKCADDLINKILILLFENYNINDHFTKFIKNTLSFDVKRSINYINIVDNNFDNIINKEIMKLKKSFFEIYTNHKILLDTDLSIFIDKIDSNNNKINDDEILIKSIELKNLGYWLNQIIYSDNKLEQKSAIKNMISIYNNLIINSNIEQINTNKDINIVLNPDLINNGSSSNDIILIISSNINTQNKTDFSVLSYTQLFDVLIYIDSLRDSSGFSDIRFSGVQNLITKELNYRTKIKKFS